MRVWSVVPETRATGYRGGHVNTETVGINYKCSHPQGPLGASQLRRG